MKSFAVPFEVSRYVREQTRERRIPVDAPANPTSLPTTANTSTAPEISFVSANSHTAGKTLYACPSGHAKAMILVATGSEERECLKRDIFGGARTTLTEMKIPKKLQNTYIFSEPQHKNR